MTNEYQLISKGVPQQGLSREAVKQRLQQHTKSPELVEKLLSERILIVKRAQKKEDLQRYAGLLHQCGLAIDLLHFSTNEIETTEPEPDYPLNAEVGVEPPPTKPFVEDQASITPLPEPQPESSRLAKYKYAFDTFMSGGSSAMFKALVVVFLGSFLAISLLRGLFLAIFPEIGLQNQTGFWGNLFTTFLQLTDPGNMAQDIFSSGWYKMFAILAGIVGVILFSSLIAFITSALEQKMRDLRQGRSTVIENDHTLILGWNDERIIEVLRELTLANESEDDACVVLLADKDKEEMDEILRLQIEDSLTTRVVTRSGKVTLQANLDQVAFEHCKSVIILAQCKDTDSADKKMASDAKVIQTILAVTGKLQEQTIVAEIFNATYKEIVRSTMSQNVVIVNTSEILAKLLVQTSRSVGLSVVYNELLSFDGCEIYFYQNVWPQIAFEDLAFYFDDGVPLGYKDCFGRLHLNPSNDTILEEGDEIIIVADDDSTVELLASPVASATADTLPELTLSKTSENQLLIGWNQKSPIIIEEFAEYVIDGTIDVLLKNPDDNIRQQVNDLDKSLDNLRVNLIEKDHLNRDQLMSLNPSGYDNIIILSSQGEQCDAQQVDSENIVCLLLLRHIFQEQSDSVEKSKTKLITEVMDSQNHSLVTRAGVKDIIISSRLLSMIMAQISENQDINMVYDDIFAEDGSEIYLKPANLYFKTLPQRISFAKMMRQAQLRNEVCIGVKIKASESEADQNFGVQLIPGKNTEFELSEEDCLVVLAEDEL